MKPLDTITDPVFVPPTYHRVDRFFLRYIRDKRDLPFVYLTLRISFSIIPMAVLLYLPFVTGWMWLVVAGLYLVLNNFIFKGTFGLMLHCTSHRPFFKKKYGFMNHYLPWIVAPFFGHSPETYYSHHIGMHHPENNMDDDESSTMKYQRDSVWAFTQYFLLFLFSGMFHLASYFIRKKRKRLMYKTVRGELLFVLFCIGMSFIHWPATLVVFIIPFMMFRLIAMMGNWGQHSFIDPKEPDNHFKNSITCINAKFNHQCWNDGYHISHHQRPTMHWTEHPVFFRKTLDQYIENNAVVFEGINFLHVFVWLMAKRYDLLAKHFVNLGNRFETEEEVMEFLKSRAQKIESIQMVSQKT